jgi:hypothetical protein
MRDKLLFEMLGAVKALRSICEPQIGNECVACGYVVDITNELLFEAAQALVDELGREGAMRTLAELHLLDPDEFVAATLRYRELILEEEPDDWEFPFYGMLLLTEPTINEEEADDER